MDITDFIIKNIKVKSKGFDNKFPSEYKKIMNMTSFLPNDAGLKERQYCIINNLSSIPTCKNCKNKVNWSKNFKTGYRDFCSKKCKSNNKQQQERMKQTNIERYGVEKPLQNNQIKEKYKQTISERYNVESPLQNNQIKEKMKKTNLERYGVEYVSQHEEIKNKIKNKCKKTNLERYGSENVFSNEKIKQKIKQMNFERYGVENVNYINFPIESLKKLKDEKWLKEQHYTNKKPLSKIAEELKINHTTVGRYLKKHKIETKHFFSSNPEKELYIFLLTLNSNVQCNKRSIIPPYEIDIYLPEYKLAIEYCGLYWHSSFYKDKNYHKIKLEMCNKEKIHLLTIFEDEWLYKPNIIKEKIKHMLKLNDEKIYARKTQIVKVDNQNKQEFFDKHHIQGNGPGSITYGLEHKNELVACMTFIKRKNYIFELNRYATSTNIPGGFSKLLNHFQSNHEYKEIVSFVDLRWNEGNLYEKTGWELDKTIPPDYSYIIGINRIHKFNFRHIHLKKKLKNYNPNLSEKQNMEMHNIQKIYDCGKKRYIIKYPALNSNL